MRAYIKVLKAHKPFILFLIGIFIINLLWLKTTVRIISFDFNNVLFIALLISFLMYLIVYFKAHQFAGSFLFGTFLSISLFVTFIAVLQDKVTSNPSYHFDELYTYNKKTLAKRNINLITTITRDSMKIHYISDKKYLNREVNNVLKKFEIDKIIQNMELHKPLFQLWKKRQIILFFDETVTANHKSIRVEVK